MQKSPKFVVRTKENMSENYQQIKDDWEVARILHQEQEEIRRCAFQSVNLTAETELALSHTYRDCLFIGCTLPLGLKKRSKDCLFLPDMVRPSITEVICTPPRSSTMAIRPRTPTATIPVMTDACTAIT